MKLTARQLRKNGRIGMVSPTGLALMRHFTTVFAVHDCQLPAHLRGELLLLQDLGYVITRITRLGPIHTLSPAGSTAVGTLRHTPYSPATTATTIYRQAALKHLERYGINFVQTVSLNICEVSDGHETSWAYTNGAVNVIRPYTMDLLVQKSKKTRHAGPVLVFSDSPSRYEHESIVTITLPFNQVPDYLDPVVLP